MTKSAEQISQAKALRNRIKGHRKIKASDLIANEKNFREHSPEQKSALQELYGSIGFARSLLAYELPDGRLKLLDGHLRADTTPDEIVDVEVLDVTEAEADVILASIDPLSAMAKTNAGSLQSLLSGMQAENQATINKILAGAGGAAAQALAEAKTEVVLKPLLPAPEMSWVLIGIPTVRVNEIEHHVQAIKDLPDILIERVSNAG